MNEYIVKVEIKKWGLIFPSKEKGTFAITAGSAAEAIKLAESGMVPGIAQYREKWDGEEDQQSYFNIKVTDVTLIHEMHLAEVRTAEAV